MGKNSKRKLYFSIFAILIAASCIFWYIKNHQIPQPALQVVSSGAAHTVILTKDGFVPAEITIHQGDTVTFTTQLSDSFWPASDLHPTHDIYPEFDPKQPVGPGKSWGFVFSKIGLWKYHDHLFSSRRGVVNVVAAGSTSVKALNCPAGSQDPQCWNEQINIALKDKGLDEAFNVMAELYQSQPAFAQSCHGYAHTLGQKAFELFSQNKDVALSPKSSYCGYGFYHGFMENLLQTTGNIQQARDFCRYAGEKLAKETSDAEGACYHGIGHGAVDGSDPTAWGEAEKMMAPGMKMCQIIAGEDASRFGKLYRCVSGAFNAIEILSADPKYKLASIQNNPFYLCPSQPQNFWEACYTNMLPAVMRFTKSDFIKSAKMVESITKDAENLVRGQVMLSLFHEWIRLNLSKPDYGTAEGLKLCRSLSSNMRLPCVEGLSGGHMQYGQPRQEYVKALAFCASSLLKQDERTVCYNYILTRLRIWYSPQKTAEICGSVPEEYQKLCSQN